MGKGATGGSPADCKESHQNSSKEREESQCVYLGERTEQTHKHEGAVYDCRLYEQCVLGKSFPDMVGCVDCSSKLLETDDRFASKWIDPLVITTAHKDPFDAFRHILRGGEAFLLCGGPSANDLPLEELNGRGCYSMAVNNMAGHPRVKPQSFICADPPSKFSHCIWLDPSIDKFVPVPKLDASRNGLRRKTKDGEFINLDRRVPDCPRTWGFKRRSWMELNDTFFTEDSAPWGNQQAGVDRTGLAKTACTMLCALRLLYYLGARTIYLVGVDFNMTSERGYSFGQKRNDDNSLSNNSQFRNVNEWLCTLAQKGVFAKFGLEIYNCYRLSGLRAFPYVPFEQALERARGIIDQVPDLGHWYEKESRDPSFQEKDNGTEI